ncbi:hypothetical protein QYE76_009498 [Lolium multiflorum]|uniref:Transposase (putative) gypsy type domain-containing protein n=1 Tax=Lolium multiflorum TaxID=4521 RepID=A0AAD8TT92_LOLMU|nr:hypothetical protein QYE76_009498 [Lolium multiflorum]
MATPISSAPPPFIPIRLDPSKDSGKEAEGTSAHPEKTSGAGQTEHQAEEVTKKSKARKRDSEAKGKWWPCTTTEMELKNLESEGFLRPGSWRSVPDELAPAPRDDEMVLTKALVERGFSFPPSDFFLEILKTYGLQPHNISPNSVLAISNHVALCEGHLRVTPEISLFQHFFSVKKIRQSGELATCGSITFMLRPGASTPPPTVTNPRELLYDELTRRTFHFSDSLSFGIRAVRRIRKLTEEGLTGKDLTLPGSPSGSGPPQHVERLMFEYTGRDDPMRATKDNLSADALDKRIRVLIKVARELHVHLEALEENELGTLLRVPSTSNADPEAASEAEAPEASRPAKRKKPAPSSPQVEAPPKASSATKPDPKDVINVDDLPEDPADHGVLRQGDLPPSPPVSARVHQPQAHEKNRAKGEWITRSGITSTICPRDFPMLRKKEPEYYGEGSGSSGEHSGEGSGDGSAAGSGDSDDGSNYQQSEEEDSE